MVKVVCFVQKGFGGLGANYRQKGPNGYVEHNVLGHFDTYAEASDEIAKKCKDANGNGHAHAITQ